MNGTVTASATTPKRNPRRQRSAQRKTPGRLVAITSTGPIYDVTAIYTAISLSSALAPNGELAARVVNSRALSPGITPPRLRAGLVQVGPTSFAY
jgi:hypothetical protein